MVQFEHDCVEKGIQLFVLPPRSPKLNGHVERAQRSHAEDFYDYYMGDLDLKSINEALREWETFYNTVRPHHSLNLKTPAEYLRENYSGFGFN
jgi:transposase InsO family protein